MKIKLSVKHDAADSPGSWGDSIIRLYIKADRPDVLRIEKAITEAIANCKGATK